MQHSQHHREVNADGVGKCGVPMWSGGCPAGFCDEPAYGEQEREQERYGQWMHHPYRWAPGYSSGLACFNHGGPASRVFRDGDSWCAVMPDFINLQESPAGFGATPEDARKALAAALARKGEV